MWDVMIFAFKPWIFLVLKRRKYIKQQPQEEENEEKSSYKGAQCCRFAVKKTMTVEYH